MRESISRGSKDDHNAGFRNPHIFLLVPDRGSEVTASESILLRWLRGYSREWGASLQPAVGQELRFALAPFVGMVISVVFASLTTTRRIGGCLAKSCLPLSRVFVPHRPGRTDPR
jgi:hypothetical protein